MTESAPIPAVSVVLPTHNRARLLGRAMHSVLDQSHGDLELVVVDDGSTDDTEQVVRSFADPRIRYIRQERNRGAPAARNLGVKEARGRFVAFQDSDDEWYRRKLEKQMAVMAACGGDDVVYCAFILSAGGRRLRIPGPRHGAPEGDLLPRLLYENFVSTQTLLTSRARIREVGGFDERLGRFQDWDLAIRLAAVARFQLVDEPLVAVHATPGNISADDAAGAAAMRIMLETHAALYRHYPEAMATALSSLGHLECLAGDVAGGRRHLWQAVQSRPAAPKAFAAFLMSLLGVRAYRCGQSVRSWLS